MTSLGDALRGAVAFLLLPLSLVPLYFAIPKIRSEVAPAEPDRAPLDAPALDAHRRRSSRGGARCRPSGAPCRCSPTTASTDAATTTRSRARQFAEQMAMLKRAGLRVDHASPNTCASSRGTR